MRDFKHQETRAARELRRGLARAVRLTNDALRLGVRIVQSQTHHATTARGAMFFLAARLLNDRRTCELLAQKGYPIQSTAMASNAFELAYRAIYVGSDENRATEWERHTDLRFSYPRDLKATMRALYRASGELEADADRMYERRYRPLAAAKHGNPTALRAFVIEQVGDTSHIFLGPIYGKPTIRACQVVLAEGVRLLEMVLRNLVTMHLADDAQARAFRRSLARTCYSSERLEAAVRKTL